MSAKQRPSPKQRRSLLAMACGGAAAALACPAAAGGLAGDAAWLRSVSGLVAMAPGTAAALLLLGAGLVCLGAERGRRYALAAAVAGAVLAALALGGGAHGLGGALRSHAGVELLARLGPTSAETALGLLAAGAGLSWRASHFWRTGRPLGASALGAATASLGLVVSCFLVAELLLGVPVYRGAMGMATAVALVFLGLGVVGSTAPVREPDALEPLGPSSLGIGLALLLAAVATSIVVTSASDPAKRVEAHLDGVETLLLSQVRSEHAALERMRRRWAFAPTREQWQADARAHLEGGALVLLAVRFGSGPDWVVARSDSQPTGGLLSGAAGPGVARTGGEVPRAVVRLPLTRPAIELVGVLDLTSILAAATRTLPPGHSLRLRADTGTPPSPPARGDGLDELQRPVSLAGAPFRIVLASPRPASSRSQLALLWLSVLVPLLSSIGWQISSTALQLGRALGASEDDLHDRSERLRIVLERTAVGTWIYDPSSEEAWVDDNSAAMFALEPGEPRNLTTFLGRVHPEDRRRIYRALSACLEHGAPYHEGFRIRRPDGSIRYLLSQGELVPKPNGAGKSLIGVTLDVTQDRRIEELIRDLERSNQDLQELAYVASHDLQEPLRMVASYLQLLEERYRGRLDPEADKFIHFAVDGARWMQALVADLLRYSQVGRGEVSDTPLDTEAALQDALQNLHVRIEESGARISWDRLPRLRGNRNEFALVFQNLLSNAIKYRGPEPPRIHIAAEERDRACVITVRDNGIGFEPSQADRIFRLFQRLHERGRYPGTGLGLAIVTRIVARHGGQVRAVSRPGEGATFHLELPTVEVDPEKPGEPPE